MMRGFVAMALWLTLCVAGSNASSAQVTVSPDSVREIVTQGEESVVWVSMQNAGAAGVSYCLDFDRPLQRTQTSSFGAGCGAPGEMLDVFDESDLGDGWWPYGITMTPDGRIFVAEDFGGGPETFELTPALEYVRRFDHPIVLEVGVTQRTVGVTYNEDTGTLWWTNVDLSGATLNQVLLLEGDMNGVATGRRIEIPVPPPTAPGGSGYPTGATYDASRKRFYYADGLRDEIWAVDTLGTVVAGYPVTLDRYPTAFLGQGVDTHPTDGGPEGIRLEVVIGLVLDLQYDRVVVTDTAGANLNLETPLGALVGAQDGPIGTSVRSRLDPNGVMYVPFFQDGGNRGVAAIRPVPLSPTWLTLSDWMGTIPAGGTSELTLTFRAGQREPGEYGSTLVVEDTAGVVLASVPLTLVVEPATPANEPGAGEAGVSLTVSPNPVAGTGSITITLARPAADVRVTVHDVLGRVMETRHVASLPTGTTRLPLDTAGLPAGVYVVRAVGAGVMATTRFSVVR